MEDYMKTKRQYSRFIALFVALAMLAAAAPATALTAEPIYKTT